MDRDLHLTNSNKVAGRVNDVYLRRGREVVKIERIDLKRLVRADVEASAILRRSSTQDFKGDPYNISEDEVVDEESNHIYLNSNLTYLS